MKILVKGTLILLGLAAFAILSFQIYLRVACKEPKALHFSADKWKAADGGNMTRFRMLPDLLAKHKLSGMSEVELLDLLGPPEKGSGQKRVGYNLGPDSPCMSVDNNWLFVEFENGRAVSHEILSD